MSKGFAIAAVILFISVSCQVDEIDTRSQHDQSRGLALASGDGPTDFGMSCGDATKLTDYTNSTENPVAGDARWLNLSIPLANELGDDDRRRYARRLASTAAEGLADYTKSCEAAGGNPDYQYVYSLKHGEPDRGFTGHYALFICARC